MRRNDNAVRMGLCSLIFSRQVFIMIVKYCRRLLRHLSRENSKHMAGWQTCK